MDRLFQLGEVCGGYRILRRLGAGGFAEVYEAADPEGALRALKILRAASPGAALGALLAREVEALARIEHVNVVQVHHAGIEDDHVYLVLELVQGVTLRDKLVDPYTPLHTLVAWTQQACEGVAEAHRVGVIHGDLKPANILVTASGVVKVIDFGVATLRSYSVPADPIVVVGTALYMAPEQLQARPSDARADVYAMGVILYEALAGAHPLGLTDEHATVFEVLQAHLFGVPTPLREAAPDVPEELAALVHRALAKDPARRVPTMRALADGLRRILASLPPPPPRVTLLGLGTDPPPRASLRGSHPFFPVPSSPLQGREGAERATPSASIVDGEADWRVRGSDPVAASPLAQDVGRSAFPPPPPRPGASPPPAPPTLPAPPKRLPSPAPREPPPPAAKSEPSFHREALLEARREAPTPAPPVPPEPPAPRSSSGVPVVAAAARSPSPRPQGLPATAVALAVVAAIAAAATWEAFTLWDARGRPPTTRAPSGKGPAAGAAPAAAAPDSGAASAAPSAEGRPRLRTRSTR